MPLPALPVCPPPPAASPVFARHPTIAIAVALAAWDRGVDCDAITGGRRGGARVAVARQLAIYLAHVALGHDLTRLASAFGRDRATIRHALRRIEDDRDRPGFDRRVSRLEAALVVLRPANDGDRA
jgi:chromosomal replication initiation ATPase DnaA